MNRPRLSVVVAPVGDGSSLPACLDALASQQDAPTIEIIVPVDASIRDCEWLRRQYPHVAFLPVDGTDADALSGDIERAHLAIDRRRAAALREARGEIVAIIEEHGRPARLWARSISRAHAELPNAVIGGAVENIRSRTVNWALFFMDAGRYQNPVPDHPVRYVTDVNVSYKREALGRVRAAWESLYVETEVHDALARLGEVHRLRRDVIMGMDRGPVRLGAALAERWAWSRLYAARRSRTLGPLKRTLLGLGAPLLLPVLLSRQVRVTLARGRLKAALLRSIPLLVLMNLVWSAGEMAGYLIGSSATSRANG